MTPASRVRGAEWSTGPARRTRPSVVAVSPRALAEVALAVVTIAAGYGLTRAFIAGDWLLPLLGQAVFAHLLMATLRRLGMPIAASLGLGVLAAVVAITVFYAPESSILGFPGPGAISELVGDIDAAVGAFDDIKAPVEAIDGLLIWAAAAIWLSALLGDWWAFRLDATLEATVPALTLFVVTTVLGTDDHAVVLVAAFGGAVVVFLLARSVDRHDGAVWAQDQSTRGTNRWLAVGTAMAIVTVAVAALVGPALPGARAEGVVDLRRLNQNDGAGSRVTVSPLVDIRSRLVQQANVVAFTVRSPRPAYWRLTSLDRFDGRIWSSTGSFGDADGDLDDGPEVRAERTTFDQEFTIRQLAQLWAPAAYEPVSVEDADVELRYDETSGTLIVGAEETTSDGSTYTVTSGLPELGPDALDTAGRSVPDDIAERYLDLPGGFPASVSDLAEEIASGQPTPYRELLALQNFFRDNFTYDIDVAAGHDLGGMVDFLNVRQGYCEQFAGTFAAMARSLGFPARVAVGFTPGQPSEADDEVYLVRGLNAHAWPEAYLDGFGWVAFEPTPGRGAPGTESYTGVPPQQAAPDNAGTAPVDIPEADPAPTPTSQPAGAAPDTPDDAPDEATSDDDGSSLLRTVLLWLVALIGVLAVYVAAVLGIAEARRRRREATATTPTAKVALAWDTVRGAGARLGAPMQRGETIDEFSSRLARRHPALAGPIGAIAARSVTAAYAPVPPSDVDAEDAATHALAIDAALREQRSPVARLLEALDPRNLLPRR